MSKSRGFTLVELAVVLAIVALVLGSIMTPLATQFQVRRARQTQSDLKEIKKALIGFAITRARLPCADIDQDGLEDRVGGNCAQAGGDLPWRDLVVSRQDGWANPYQYRVTQEFTYPTIPGAPGGTFQLDLSDTGDITVNVPEAMGSIAVVVSSGIDGAFDAENTDGDAIFTGGAYTAAFDDQLIVLSRPIVMYQLVQSRNLP